MLIFIDTEFTDFANTELISIGLITEDGKHEFYAELPFNRRSCNNFVLQTVLPQLGKKLEAQCSTQELKTRLGAWLEQFKNCEEVTICFDFGGDWLLFQYALGGTVPDWLTAKNIYRNIDQAALAKFFEENELLEHHALNDAKANRHVFVASIE